jgi:iron complex transport system ATP-binding protein
LDGVSIARTPRGAITALVGPNAAGKTTLLKCVAGLLRYQGRVLLDGRDVGPMRRGELSRRLSYLPQEVPVHAVLTVFEAVLLARHDAFAWRVGQDDLTLVADTLRELDIDHLAMRYLNELSGGQRQLVSIAQALVRRPEVLLLDEPTSNLDLQRQLDVLALVRRVSAERGITTLITLHDLNLAARYAAHFVVLHAGSVYASGRADDVLTPAMLRDVYGVQADVLRGADGVPQATAIASLRRNAFQPE